MKRIFTILLLLAAFTMCHAQKNEVIPVLTAQECKYILEVFCQKFYSSCFEGKEYIPGTLIIKAVGVDQNNDGTFVSGLHTYQGVYVPFKGRKTHNDVQFTANIVGQPTGYYVIFNKWYEPDLFKKHGEWETGKILVPFE